EIAVGEIEQREETGGQRAAVVEEGVDRIGHRLLVLVERRTVAERSREVEEYVRGRVAQSRGKVWWGYRNGIEGSAAEAASCVQDVVALPRVAAGCEHGLHGAGERCGAHIGNRGGRGVDLHEVDRARLEREIAGYGHRTSGADGPRRESAATIDGDVAHGADAGERAARVHRHARIDHRAVHGQRAGEDRPRQRRTVGPGQGPSAAAGLLKNAEVEILDTDLRDVEV